MPPLRGIDRGLTGEALKALEESGHGRRLAIVDASYNVPRWAQVVNYGDGSSADALFGIAKLVPVEGKLLTLMLQDPEDTSEVGGESHEAFFLARGRLAEILDIELTIEALYREDNATDRPGNAKGFYSLANNQAEDTLFVRTRDSLPYACASFMIGHSQFTE